MGPRGSGLSRELLQRRGLPGKARGFRRPYRKPGTFTGAGAMYNRAGETFRESGQSRGAATRVTPGFPRRGVPCGNVSWRPDEPHRPRSLRLAAPAPMQLKVAEPADKPGPVVDSHSSRRIVADTLEQPTR